MSPNVIIVITKFRKQSLVKVQEKITGDGLDSVCNPSWRRYLVSIQMIPPVKREIILSVSCHGDTIVDAKKIRKKQKTSVFILKGIKDSDSGVI